MSLDQRSQTARRGHTFLFAGLQVAITLGIFGFLAAQWGMTPFMDAFRLLPVWIFPAAALLGGIGVLTQALRWRVIARHHRISIGVGPAIARCWQAAFLNGVLPGGLAGDALRAADDSSDAEVEAGGSALRRAFAAMAAERLMGTAVAFIAAGLTLLVLAPLAGLASLGVATAAVVVAWRWLKPLSRGDLIQVVLLSATGWAAFAALFALTILVVTPTIPLAWAPGLAAVAIAGMSVPLGFGGWGPREAAAAWAFSLAGFAPHLGVTASISYGLLALASTLPGAIILALRVLPRLERARRVRDRREGRGSA
ncbi:flippase-like domain-containing protein [Nesterenkonia sp. YGD6]|uniref:lysylphosphatidylglycerol synthase transmembrane domain-containing protein n=1 Tax=Nesterenkonia sp. YGD6 TaxID=2901231 RepID=UPI001F4CF7CA|nr:lysylphosphatidylglycerol synthase transmembrane domain-containing protein [Nesterenkonia sp. YGD6]MCH8563911.1 flippase-like domain-containing protein [Nesterenkonia sp. YGD6]